MGLVGLGKIAQDEHLPAIVRTEGAELIAVASRNASAEGVTNYPDLAAMLAGETGLDAIILCQPPQYRFAAAQMALAAGKHVFLEKPPGATLSEVDALVAQAAAQDVTLYASWHSRYSSHVGKFREWCSNNKIRSVVINWKEDVRRWHPGQDWIWQAGGFGVFDPGINALSILTEVLPERVRLIDATLTFPDRRAAPIAVDMVMETASGAPITAAFDWRQTGAQTWEIVVESEDDRFVFAQGSEVGADCAPDAESALAEEYRAMYAHFVGLVRSGQSDVDLAPLKLVADSFLRGQTVTTDAFDW